ncbi:GNAT family N-acetyltransferase [Clostridium sp.]|uniref:GNAT family N-acetyltransferase n=1 Tax=Clostridium sp. TaxID=1506 RepID=UPI003F3A51A8
MVIKIEKIIKEVILKNEEKITFRKATSEDAENIIKYLKVVGGESDNLLFGEGEFNLTIEQEKAFIEGANSNLNSLMLLGIIDGKIVSISNISTPMRKRIIHNGELAISVKKEYWGLGIGTLVIETLIQFAKETKVIKNISLGVRKGNIKAYNLYKKMGFEEVGIHKNFFNINGEFYDEILMDLYIED